jgi:hypothetical protein
MDYDFIDFLRLGVVQSTPQRMPFAGLLANHDRADSTVLTTTVPTATVQTVLLQVRLTPQRDSRGYGGCGH